LGTFVLNLEKLPSNGSITNSTSYDSGYTLIEDSGTKRLSVAAPGAELGEIISVTR
jgi:hypothetical protein